MEWRTLDGYRYPVRVSDQGDVERQLPNGKWRKLTPYRDKQHSWRVRPYLPNGKRRSESVSKLVADCFLGGTPPGMCRVHKNGMQHDNAVENIVFRSFSGAAKSQRPPRSKPVAKVDKDGNVVAVYKTQKEAAEKNHISKAAICQRCMGKVKKPFALDGFNYVFA